MYIINKFKKIGTFSLFFYISICAWSFPTIDSVKYTHQTCLGNGSITVYATGDSVVCAILDHSGQPNIWRSTPAGTPINALPAATYKIGIFDKTTGYTRSVAVEWSAPIVIQDLFTRPTTGVISTTPNINEKCIANGQILFSINAGSPPYTIFLFDNNNDEIISKRITNSFNNIESFKNLTSGNYRYEVQDMCNSKPPAVNFTINDDSPHLKDVNLNSFLITGNYSSFARCNILELTFNASNFLINYSGGNPTSMPTYRDFKYTITYRGQEFVGSIYSGNIVFSINNYSSSFKNYELSINTLPCNSSTYKVNMVIPDERNNYFIKYTPSNVRYDDFCSYSTGDGVIDVELKRDNFENITNTTCNEKVRLIDQNTNELISDEPLNSDGKVSFTGTHGLLPNKSYIVRIMRGLTILYQEVISTSEGIVNPIETTTDFFQGDQYGSSNESLYGYNFSRSCDYNTTAIIALLNKNISFAGPDKKITYRISLRSNPGVYIRDSIVKIVNPGETAFPLWTDLDYGYEYQIDIDYHCPKKETKYIILTKKINKLSILDKEFQESQQCNEYDVAITAAFYDIQNKPIFIFNMIPENHWSRYIVEIVEGPAELNVIPSPIESYSGLPAVFEELPQGHYKFKVYPYHLKNNPLKDGAADGICILETEITTPIHDPLGIDYLHSGGIACEDTATLTVASTGGRGSIEYQLFDDQRQALTGFQISNKFHGLHPGQYYVTIKDNVCISSIQPLLSLFHGTDNFALIDAYIVDNGDTIGCKGTNITLSVGSIGAVISYEWSFKKKNTGTYIPLPGGNGPTYTITDFSEENVGSYQIKIHNGSCFLSSFINLNGISNKIKAPVLAADKNPVCPGDSTYLRVTTSDNTPPPTFYWYKGGVLIDSTNSAMRYIKVGDAGNYHVEIKAINEKRCPSDPSNVINLLVKKPDTPVIDPATSNKHYCEGSTATLNATNVAGASYTWFKDGVLIPGKTTFTITVNTAGNYKVIYTTGGKNCETDTSNVFTVAEIPLPTPPVISSTFAEKICEKGNAVITLTGNDATTNIKWYKDGVLISGQTNNTLTVTQTGTYTATLILKASPYCESKHSNKLSFKVIKCIEARDDKMYVFECLSDSLFVLGNDSLQTMNPSISITGAGPSKGTTTPNNTFNPKFILYKNTSCVGGEEDHFTYKITTADTHATANVTVEILKKPEIILLDSCSAKPMLSLSIQYPLQPAMPYVHYKWEYSTNNSTWLSLAAFDNKATVDAVSKGEVWYRVKVAFYYLNPTDTKVYSTDYTTTSRKVHILETKNLPSGKWYNVSLQ